MTVVTGLQTLPRVLVEGYLRATRLPLTAIERAMRQRHNEQWPPALAYERFEAGVETVVGSVLRDAVLVDKGRLRQAKVGQLRQAAELRTVAEQTRAQADSKLQERREQLEQQRDASQRNAEQHKQQLERQAAQQEQQADHKAAKRASAARQQKSAQDKAIARQERAAKTQALAEESRALELTKEALDADHVVDVVQETLEGTKEARKTS